MFGRRFGTTAVVAGLVALSATVLTATPAAADTCVGSQVASMNTTNPANGNIIAITRAYRGNGQICVVSVKQNGYYGKLTYMELWMYKSGVSPKVDKGNFYYMAGPVRMTDNGCIHFELDLWNGPVPGGGVNIRQDYYYPGVNC
ncbi:hypothetical protein [Labedaea rhizosphaerae]|uniref:Spore-associated protein A n=1 Tax=Labedaea rhizosphaerae TaxID=598644 RepID=A0A4R6SFB2_LABRH|nr:hypothetical protein [Labedaea rhizosphaerae]TDQ00254.1 hypothetical protein EV186_102115 [Labedaea rhizosphaerae]